MDTPVFTNPYLGYILLVAFVIYLINAVIQIKNEGRLLSIGFLVGCQIIIILGSFWLIDNGYSLWIVLLLGFIGVHLCFKLFDSVFENDDDNK